VSHKPQKILVIHPVTDAEKKAAGQVIDRHSKSDKDNAELREALNLPKK